MEITIVCVPFQIDGARWGCAGGPQAFLEAGSAQQIEARGHSIRNGVWIELPKAERTRDSVTNLGRIAQRIAFGVKNALAENESFVLVLEGDCTHAVGAMGGLAQAQGPPGVVWFDAHGDLNTMETTTTGFLGGMPCKRCITTSPVRSGSKVSSQGRRKRYPGRSEAWSTRLSRQR